MSITLPSGRPSGLMIPDHPAFLERPEVPGLLAEEDRLLKARMAIFRQAEECEAENRRRHAEWAPAARAAVLAGAAPPPKPEQVGSTAAGVINFPEEFARLHERAEQVVNAAAAEVLPRIRADLAAVVAEARPHAEALEHIAARANDLQSVEQHCLIAPSGGRIPAPKPHLTPARLLAGPSDENEHF